MKQAGKKGLQVVPPGGSISVKHGQPQYFTGTDIDTIENVFGKTVVLGIGKNATVRMVKGAHGTLILCNMSAETVMESGGNVRVYDGDVGDVIQVHGHLWVYGGSIFGQIINSGNNIRVFP